MKRNMTCPSASPHRAPATTNASPAAFSMTSSDIRMNIRFRRDNTPISPRLKSTAATLNPEASGMSTIMELAGAVHLAPTEVVRANERGEQQHRRDLNAE